MGKSLVIVESPAKAKTINKYLGKDFVVKSSVGHVRDLPTAGQSTGEKAAAISTKGMSVEEKARIKQEKDRNALIKKMGIDPYHDWAANYQILPGKEKVVSELQKLAKDADFVYLATDLDREGEAIAWHLREIIGGDEARYKRVVFNEITKNAIQHHSKNLAISIWMGLTHNKRVDSWTALWALWCPRYCGRKWLAVCLLVVCNRSL